MLDYGALPPEINSGRMYTGPGSAPLMAAASAWDSVAAELGTAATGYSSMITELTGSPWLGPTSRAMMAAVTPYVSWIGAAAAQAEETASQARAAAAAFETTFTLTVPPPVIAANRVLLATLVATNFFGQNTSGDRGHRGPVPGDVGSGCGGDVRLCQFVGDCHRAEPIPRSAEHHHGGCGGGSVGRGRPGHRDAGWRVRADRRVRSHAADCVGAAGAAAAVGAATPAAITTQHGLIWNTIEDFLT